MTDLRLDRRKFVNGSLAALAAAGLPGSLRAQSATSRPNLILYFVDEMRADALACYGNPVTHTPNLDLLARQGTRFAQCHAQYPVCGASRCSLLTGWPTSVRGHRSLYYFLRPDEPNMFRYLKQAGYDVYWFGKNDALSQESFASSVTQWFDVPSQWSGAGQGPRPAQHEVKPTLMMFPGGADRRGTGDYQLLQRAIEVMSQKERDKPFCIFLPLSQPHPPYVAPEGFDTMYKPEDLPALAPPDLPKKPSYYRGIREYYHLDQATDADMRKVRATYYGQVSYADWLLGELMEALDKTGRANDTALFFSSDHGDYAGDYGLVEKWPSGLESCLTHVPLIARIPGGSAGNVVNEMIELFDIMPSMLELGGTRATHTNFARTLVPQLHGAPADPARAAFSEGGYNVSEPQAFEPVLPGLYEPKTRLQNERPQTITRCASVKTRQYNYVSRPEGLSELYDRQADPQETRNLIDERSHAKVLAEMEQQLLDWYITTSGVPASDKDSRDTPPFYPTPSFDAVSPAA